MENAYKIIFLVGVIYAVVTFLIGGLLDFAHFGGHIDTNINTHFDGDLGPHIDTGGVSSIFSLIPLKPITIVSFITVFGGIGVMGTHNNYNGALIFVIAVISGILVSFILYRFIVVPLYKAQNTSSVTQDHLIGLNAQVIEHIMEEGFGTIAYEVNGSKYNAPAQHVSKKEIKQGEEVMIYQIKDNVFYVQPLDDKN